MAPKHNPLKQGLKHAEGSAVLPLTNGAPKHNPLKQGLKRHFKMTTIKSIFAPKHNPLKQGLKLGG